LKATADEKAPQEGVTDREVCEKNRVQMDGTRIANPRKGLKAQEVHSLKDLKALGGKKDHKLGGL